MARARSIYIVTADLYGGRKITIAALTVKHEAISHIQRFLRVMPDAVISIDQWRDGGGFVCTKTAEEFITPKPSP